MRTTGEKLCEKDEKLGEKGNRDTCMISQKSLKFPNKLKIIQLRLSLAGDLSIVKKICITKTKK